MCVGVRSNSHSNRVRIAFGIWLQNLNAVGCSPSLSVSFIRIHSLCVCVPPWEGGQRRPLFTFTPLRHFFFFFLSLLPPLSLSFFLSLLPTLFHPSSSLPLSFSFFRLDLLPTFLLHRTSLASLPNPASRHSPSPSPTPPQHKRTSLLLSLSQVLCPTLLTHHNTQYTTAKKVG